MSELHYTTGPWVFDKDNPVRVLDNTGIKIAATSGGMVGDIEFFADGGRFTSRSQII